MIEKRAGTCSKSAVYSVILLAILVISTVYCTGVGVADIGFWKALHIIKSHLPFTGEGLPLDVTKGEDLIVMNIRLPRLLLAGIVGASLAMVGVVFQGLLLNPLADPYTVGISFGAAFGATLAILLQPYVGIFQRLMLHINIIPWFLQVLL